MRCRITYLFKPSQFIDPNTLNITQNSISSNFPITYATEEKITFNVDELPSELRQLQKVTHELHIRWASQNSYERTDPLVSTLSPGLHLFFTPQIKKNLTSVCWILKKAFGEMDCINPEVSFTTPPPNQLSNQTYLQFYALLPSISNFAEYLSHISCSDLPSHLSKPCIDRLNLLKTISSLDISLNFESDTATISSFTPFQKKVLCLEVPEKHGSKSQVRYEIGFLTNHQSQRLEETSLGGFLIVLGVDRSPKPTLFSFSSRHRSSNHSFRAFFLTPSGMHPDLELRVSDVTEPVENQSCELYAHLTIPRTIFLDKYQFLDRLFLMERNIKELKYISDSVDLEAPEYTLSTWGSSVLIRLAQPSAKPNDGREWVGRIPTHLRYQLPASNSDGVREVDVPFPVMFWACAPEDTFDFSRDPFDRVHLGYDDLFAPKTLFYHLNPDTLGNNRKLVNSLIVPVLDLEYSGLVERWTNIAIGIGFVWVLCCLLHVAIKFGYGSNRNKIINNEKKSQ